MKNSYKFQNSFNDKDFNQSSLTISNNHLYSLSYAILFAKKRDARNFLKKIKEAKFLVASRNANLFRITIANTQLESAVLNANKFLEIAKKEESEILANFKYNN